MDQLCPGCRYLLYESHYSELARWASTWAQEHHGNCQAFRAAATQGGCRDCISIYRSFSKEGLSQANASPGKRIYCSIPRSSSGIPYSYAFEFHGPDIWFSKVFCRSSLDASEKALVEEQTPQIDTVGGGRFTFSPLSWETVLWPHRSGTKSCGPNRAV